MEGAVCRAFVGAAQWPVDDPSLREELIRHLRAASGALVDVGHATDTCKQMHGMTNMNISTNIDIEQALQETEKINNGD